MRMFKIKLYYYLGCLCYLMGVKYVFINPLYSLYSYLMVKSSELDTNNQFWNKNKE